MRPRFIDFKYISRALDETFSTLKTPSIFNTGELSDSLMNPALMEKIVDKFEEQKRHKVFLLSKFGPKNVEFLVRKPRKQVICAWSINAIEAARRWEKAAAHPERRIEAAKLVYRVGYDTRVRIDPMFPIEDWKTHYEDILYRIFDAFEPRRVILGTPRGLWKTIEYAKRAGVDMSWSDYFAPQETGWGKKMPEAIRLEMYQYMMDKLQGIGYPRSRVTLCKETVSLWERSGLKPKKFNCNCYGPDALID
jgi:DNA repair photolyase